MKRKNIGYFMIILFVMILLYFFDVRSIINKNMRFIYWIIHIFLMIIVGSLVWAEQKNIKFEKIYLFSLTILCAIYIILFPPSTVNDEHFHITMAYHFSNVLLRTEEYDKDRSLDNSCTYIREGDVNVIVEESYYWGPSDRIAGRPDVETYEKISKNILKQYEGDNKLIAGIPGYSKMVNIIEYFPAAVGMALARLFNWNTYLLLYIAKIFNAFTYIFLCYVAISRIPQFKVSVALVSMLPVALQEATAISYDCVTNAVSYCLFAELILIILSEQIGKKSIILILIYTTILALCKAGVYIFLIGIGGIELFRKKIKLREKIIGCSILVVNIIMIILYYLQGRTNNNGSSDKYSVSFILDQPLEFIGMCVKTIVSNFSYYVESAMGARMGWNQSVVPAFVAFAFVIILLMSTRFYDNTSSIISIQNKIVSIAVVLMEIMVIMAALLTDTWVGSITVSGIQGRYFLPIIPVILIIFAKRDSCVQDKVNNYTIVKYFMFVHMMEVYYLMRLYFSR